MSTNECPSYPVIIVDDEEHFLTGMALTLESHGIDNTIPCQDGRILNELIQKNDPDLILLDLNLTYESGEELLSFIKDNYPDLPVIIVTGEQDISLAVKCMKTGAFDYILKPLEPQRLISTVRRALEIREMTRENRRLRELVFRPQANISDNFPEIKTVNKNMFSIFSYITAVAQSPMPVLVTGETGTGKGLIARAIHDQSRRQGKLVTVDVASLDDTVFSDALFGHEKGAYTDAVKERLGLVEKAANGTLFLDEIGDLPESSQIKLLRLIQEKEYYPIGSDKIKYSSARIICATHKDINTLLESGVFRRDLFYRLNIHHIHLPALRERLDDLPILIGHFSAEAAKTLDKNVPEISPEVFSVLSGYGFPGNIRELQALVFNAVSMSDRELSKDHFLSQIKKWQPEKMPRQEKEDRQNFFSTMSTLPTIKEATSMLVKEALSRADNNQSKAAKLLGISQQALSKRLK